MAMIELQLACERGERVKDMTLQGCTAADIAAAMQISERTVVRIRRRVGVARPAYPALTTGEIDTARLLLEDGASLAEAARTIGRSSDALAARFSGFGWTAQQCGAFTAALRYWRAER